MQLFIKLQLFSIPFSYTRDTRARFTSCDLKMFNHVIFGPCTLFTVLIPLNLCLFQTNSTQYYSNTTCNKTFLITTFRTNPSNLNSRALKTYTVYYTRATALRIKKRNSLYQIGPNPLYLPPRLYIYSNLYVQLLLRPDSIDFGLPTQPTLLLLQPPPLPIQATLETYLEPS